MQNIDIPVDDEKDRVISGVPLSLYNDDARCNLEYYTQNIDQIIYEIINQPDEEKIEIIECVIKAQVVLQPLYVREILAVSMLSGLIKPQNNIKRLNSPNSVRNIHLHSDEEDTRSASNKKARYIS